MAKKLSTADIYSGFLFGDGRSLINQVVDEMKDGGATIQDINAAMCFLRELRAKWEAKMRKEDRGRVWTHS